MKHKDTRDSFMKKLDARKEMQQRLDSGTWSPSHKGQTFIQAIEKHKGDNAFIR